MKKTLLIIITLLAWATLFAQHNSIKVNGMEISYCFSEAQIIDSLGVPTTIIADDPDFEGWITYRYTDSVTGLFNDFLFIYGSLQDIAIRGKDFKLNNFLEVGMDVSAVSQMGGVIFGVEPDLFYWAPNEEYKNIGHVTVFIDEATQKIKLIGVETTSDIM